MLSQNTIDAIVAFATVEMRLTRLAMRGKRLSEAAINQERAAVIRLVKTYGITDRAEVTKSVDALMERIA